MLLLERLILKLLEHGAIFTTMEDAADEYAERFPLAG